MVGDNRELTVQLNGGEGRQNSLDLDNLLANAEIGALYLDGDMRVRRVTQLMCEHTQLSMQDVGKKLDEISFLAEYDDWREDVERCVSQNIELEREIVHEGVVILFRICPYRDAKGRAEGAIIILFDITSRRRREEELRERSYKDSMTGLLNHTAVQTRVEERLSGLKAGQEAYLIIFDIDNFKQINDVNGHFFGDAVIRSFAEELERQLPDAVKGRFGGDEFLAYVENMERKELEQRLNAINHFMSDRFDDDKMRQTISCSIGAALIGQERNDYTVAFQWADCALYKVKNRHKGHFRILRVPEDGSLPQSGYLPRDGEEEDFVDEETTLIRTEEELVLFCMELLENVPDITAALKMISERTCRFYDLDDMVCVEHAGASNHILYQWSQIDKTEFTQRMHEEGVYEWGHLSRLTDPDGCIAYRAKTMKGLEMEQAKTAFIVLSTSVRDYSGSIVFSDRRKERDWVRMKSTLVRIANQIFYRRRMLQREAERRRTMDLQLNYDRLTGLPVYHRFIASANDYMEHYGNGELCCISTDFSGFQYYNDIYGYEMGDDILKRFADALTVQYGDCGIFTRVSSDHFVGLVRGMTLEEAQAGYREFTVSFAEVCNREYPLTNLALASGIYEVQKEDVSVSVMVDNANAARKKCKEQKVETMVKVYTESLRQEQERVKNINSNILKGLKNGEFHAYLQPKVSLKTNKIEGAEALVRWIRPDGTRVMPEEFIGIAEKNGYITKIDFAVLDQVLEYLEEAITAGEEVVPISVNFSRRNNEFENFVPSILKRLEQHHVPGNLLEAEVTESIFMADLSTVDNNMNRLRGEGVEVSVDDFGSGYSSLNMLAKISADTIKLDRLFLNNAKRDERGLTVIQYLTKMLKRLGFTVLAEGVETEEQLDWMKMADCDLVQGFYYAKPMSIADFRAFLADFNSGVRHEEKEFV